MNHWQASRRRIVAGLSVLGLMPFMGNAAFAKEAKKLPQCLKTGKMGHWVIQGGVSSFRASQKLSHNGLDLWINFIGPSGVMSQHNDKTYFTLELVMKREQAESNNIEKLTVFEKDREIVSVPLKHNHKLRYSRFDIDVRMDFLRKIDRPGNKWVIRTNASAQIPPQIYEFILPIDGLIRAFRAAEKYHLKAKEQHKAAACASFSSCFLSTAACSYVGLDDDCWELTALRHFRDTVLLKSQQGRQFVEEYYRIAPDLVQKLTARGDASKQLASIYWMCVLPCAVLSKTGAHKLATALYSRQVRLLQHL